MVDESRRVVPHAPFSLFCLCGNKRKGKIMEDFIISFSMKIDTASYARRFGIELPDDSMDVTLTEESSETIREQETDGTSQVATEDAAITYRQRAAAYDPQNTQCKATLAQCRAKNPMTCRYHGAKVIAQDIENDLAAAGIQASNVEVQIADVSMAGGKQTLTLAVVVKGKAKDKKSVVAAMKNFFALPGVDGDVKDIDYMSGEITALFDIDMLDPNAQAKWGMGQTPPQQQAPAQPQSQPAKPAQPKPAPVQTPAPAQTPPAPQPQQQPLPAPVRSKLPTRPEEPPPWLGLAEDDFDFLDNTSVSLAFVGQRINRNIENGNFGAGTQALQGFRDIDKSRLEDLAQKDDTGQAQKLLDIYNEVAASEKNGWQDKILPSFWDPSKYNANDPSQSMQTKTWAFDRSKCPTDPYAKQRLLYKNWKDPASIRKEEISKLNGSIRGAVGADKQMLDAAINAAETASAGMSDFEDNIKAVEDAIANETDPGARSALEGLLADIETEYAKRSAEYKQAAATVKDWASKQRLMSVGDTVDDIISKYQAKGETPPVQFNKNTQKTIDGHAAKAKKSLMKRYKISAADWPRCESNWKKNIATLLNGASIRISMGYTALTSLLADPSKGARNGKYQASSMDSDYVRIGKHCFDVTYKTPAEQHKYGAIFPNTGAHSLSSDSLCYGEYEVEFDAKKIVGFMGGEHSRTRGMPQYDDRCGSLLTDASVATATCFQCENLLKNDYSGQSDAAAKVLKELSDIPELWFCGDVTRDMVKSVFCSVKSDQKAVKALPFVQKNSINVN